MPITFSLPKSVPQSFCGTASPASPSRSGSCPSPSAVSLSVGANGGEAPSALAFSSRRTVVLDAAMRTSCDFSSFWNLVRLPSFPERPTSSPAASRALWNAALASSTRLNLWHATPHSSQRRDKSSGQPPFSSRFSPNTRCMALSERLNPRSVSWRREGAPNSCDSRVSWWAVADRATHQLDVMTCVRASRTLPVTISSTRT
mmetsp:Transcript_10321/g.32891  ORF Transcript_10321/g.32891 Transcript_10321/m.32891 type:complete len:202 (+) Transcript_10321:1727-2332(+)